MQEKSRDADEVLDCTRKLRKRNGNCSGIARFATGDGSIVFQFRRQRSEVRIQIHKDARTVPMAPLVPINKRDSSSYKAIIKINAGNTKRKMLSTKDRRPIHAVKPLLEDADISC